MTDQSDSPRLGAKSLVYNVEGITNFYTDGTAGFTCGSCGLDSRIKGTKEVTLPSVHICMHCSKRNLL